MLVLKNFGHDWLNFWQNAFNFRGRLDRLSFWRNLGVQMLAVTIFLVVTLLVFLLKNPYLMLAFNMAFALYCVASLIPLVSSSVRRIRDAGLSGLYSGLAIGIIFLGIGEGDVLSFWGMARLVLVILMSIFLILPAGVLLNYNVVPGQKEKMATLFKDGE